jgi:hypothetical protein
MATKLALKAVPKAPTTAPKKKQRERLVIIETPPKPDWFVSTRERGRTVWYLRLTITGAHPRRFGPFANRHRALLALDLMLNSLTDLNCELADAAKKYGMTRRFQQTWGPVIEDELALPNGGR